MQKPDLKTFPLTPGVYLYYDASGRIIYVGKAKSLRKRIASYFRDDHKLTAKTATMLRHAVRIETLQTSTEKESLLLEASLIKKHRPRYNILLRDDKEYLLFKIAKGHPYPRVEIIRRRANKVAEQKDLGLKATPSKKVPTEKAEIFGPFSSGGAARETWKLIHNYFPLRRCKDRAFTNRTRPCLYYDMGRCLAPCVLPVAQEEYNALLRKVELLLSGRSRELIDILKQEMQSASSALDFEQAALLRDRMRAIERTIERQSVVLAPGLNVDLAGTAEMPEGLALGILFVRDGLLVDGRNFFWPGLATEDLPELITGFLSQFYLARNTLGESIPPRIVIPWLPNEMAENIPNIEQDTDTTTENQSGIRTLTSILAEYRGGIVNIDRPRNADEDKLVLMAASNAREAAKIQTKPDLANILAERLQQQSAKNPIRRIEVVDISHTSGQQTRAGMVVFEDEEPLKSSYRTYILDEIMAANEAEAGDDYAALAAWAKRRSQSGPPWPDLILIDGGKGQLAAVQRTFTEEQVIDNFLLASIAKARTEDGRSDRRAGNVEDRIFLPHRSNPLNIAPGSPELLYLQRIRDAAHDFVIGRHRKARAAAALTGELTRLPGIGPKTAKLLFDHFGSLKAMAEAGEDALQNIPGIGAEKAKLIAERLLILVKK